MLKPSSLKIQSNAHWLKKKINKCQCKAPRVCLQISMKRRLFENTFKFIFIVKNHDCSNSLCSLYVCTTVNILNVIVIVNGGFSEYVFFNCNYYNLKCPIFFSVTTKFQLETLGASASRLRVWYKEFAEKCRD